MKKYILWFLFFMSAFPLHAWVFLDNTTNTDGGWLLPKLLSGKPVRVCVDVLSRTRDASDGRYRVEAYRGPQRDAYYAMSAQIVYTAYQKWFDNLRGAIRSSGRKKEFSDLLARLPKTPSIQFVNIGPGAGQDAYKSCESYPQEAIDLRVRATLYRSGSGGFAVQTGRASFTFQLKPDNTGLVPPKDIVMDRTSLVVALHEAGHTLGLGDLYGNGENDHNSPVYTLQNIYPQENTRSIMNREEELTCDDAEGLANLIDFFVTAESSRSTGGWLGFCPQRLVAYAKGLPLGINSAEEQDLRLFVKHGRKDPSPLAGKIAAAEEKAAHYVKVKQLARTKAEKGVRQQLQEAFAPARSAR